MTSTARPLSGRGRVAAWFLGATAAFALAALLAPGASQAAEAPVSVCLQDCEKGAEVTVDVPAREVPLPTPSPTPPPTPPATSPATPPPPGGGGSSSTPAGGSSGAKAAAPTSWGTNATSPAASAPSPAAARASAPKVGEGPQKGIGGARFKDAEHPQPGEKAVLIAEGFTPSEQVQVVVFSKPIVLGSWAVDEAGHFEQEIEIPATLLPGDHTVEVTGWQSGAVQNVEFAISPASWAKADDAKVWTWWLLGGVGAAIALALAALIAVRRRAERRPAAVTS